MSTSPTALKRWIAGELTRLRERNGITRAEAAKAIRGSIQNIGHFEVGRRMPKSLELETLLRFYGVPDRVEFFLSLRDVAKKGTDWWVGFDADDSALPQYFKLFLGLEAMASKIESWDVQVVPGLFQTGDYAEAVVRAGEPELPDGEVTRRIDLRMARQREVLEREHPPSVWAVLDEAALRRVIGGADMMRAQLDLLVRLAQRPNVEVQVLPLDAGAHAGTEGAFTVLTYPPDFDGDLGMVYAETRVRGIYYDEQEDVRKYRETLTRLQVAACKPRDSIELIKRLSKDL